MVNNKTSSDDNLWRKKIVKIQPAMATLIQTNNKQCNMVLPVKQAYGELIIYSLLPTRSLRDDRNDEWLVDEFILSSEISNQLQNTCKRLLPEAKSVYKTGNPLNILQ
jgi:hypothetical protein